MFITCSLPPLSPHSSAGCQFPGAAHLLGVSTVEGELTLDRSDGSELVGDAGGEEPAPA